MKWNYQNKNFAFVEQSGTMKAPVGLLSDRTVLRQQDGGASPRQVRVCGAKRNNESPSGTYGAKQKPGTFWSRFGPEKVPGFVQCFFGGAVLQQPPFQFVVPACKAVYLRAIISV